jgi:fucose permease
VQVAGLTRSKTVANAATYGLAKQANLKGSEFSLLVTLFYTGYFLAQYPTNLLMQRFPTVKYITVNFILWG